MSLASMPTIILSARWTAQSPILLGLWQCPDQLFQSKLYFQMNSVILLQESQIDEN